MAIIPSVQSLYDRALQIIKEHNENLADEVTSDTPGYIDPDKFLSCIKSSGGTSESRLRKLKYKDILRCFPETDGVKPEALVTEIAYAFRGNSEKTEAKPKDSHEPRPVSKSKASKMSLRELIERYDPLDATNPVGKRLSDISKGQPFIAFSDGRQVDVESSLILLGEIKQGFKGREIFNSKRVYVVGFIPDNDVDENPIYRERPLRPDGTCDQLNRSWDGIPKNARQFVAFALEHQDGPNIRGDRDKAWGLFDLALVGMDELRKRYPTVAVDFDDADKRSELPHLLITLGQPGDDQEEGSQGPFEQGQQVAWVKPENLADTPRNYMSRDLHSKQAPPPLGDKHHYGPTGNVRRNRPKK